MIVKRPLLIKNILIECGMPPGTSTQNLTKRQLERILLTVTNQKTVIKNLENQLAVLINAKIEDSNGKSKGTQKS